MLRTYTDAYVWSAPDGDVEVALSGSPRRIPLPATAQGEAVAVAPDGRSLLTTHRGAARTGARGAARRRGTRADRADRRPGRPDRPDRLADAAAGNGGPSLLGPAVGVAALAALVLLAGRLIRRR